MNTLDMYMMLNETRDRIEDSLEVLRRMRWENIALDRSQRVGLDAIRCRLDALEREMTNRCRRAYDQLTRDGIKEMEEEE